MESMSENRWADLSYPGPDLVIWEFPKIGGAIFWGPYKKDPTI